jgi:hypothetical protein
VLCFTKSSPVSERALLLEALTLCPSLHAQKADGVQSTDEMVLTGEHGSTWRKTTNLAWISVGSNQGLRGEKPANNRLSHGTAIFLYNLI